jgi:hypothetical protein
VVLVYLTKCEAFSSVLTVRSLSHVDGERERESGIAL